MTLFFKLIFAHVIADFAFQTDWVKKAKVDDAMFLAAHALINGAMVYYVTGSIGIGLIESVLHFCIDKAKCMGWIGVGTDQAIHVATKLVYVGMIQWMM